MLFDSIKPSLWCQMSPSANVEGCEPFWMCSGTRLDVDAGKDSGPVNVAYPPVIATLLAFCVAMVPRPRFVRAVDADARSDRLFAL